MKATSLNFPFWFGSEVDICNGKKTADGKSVDGGLAAALQHQLGEHCAGGRADLETGAAKTETVEQAVLRAARPQYRLAVGQIAFDAAPGADDVDVAQSRQQRYRLRQQRQDGVVRRARTK